MPSSSEISAPRPSASSTNVSISWEGTRPRMIVSGSAEPSPPSSLAPLPPASPSSSPPLPVPQAVSASAAAAATAAQRIVRFISRTSWLGGAGAPAWGAETSLHQRLDGEHGFHRTDAEADALGNRWLHLGNRLAVAEPRPSADGRAAAQRPVTARRNGPRAVVDDRGGRARRAQLRLPAH